MDAAPVPSVPIANTKLTSFYGDMTPPERRAFWACFTGWALDGVDFMIYPLVLSTIIATWHVDRSWAGFATTLTLLASAVGGWLAGYLSDRIGRVRTLQITVLWFSLFTFLCAFAQDFTQLTIARAFVGIGFGGEWAAGAVLMGETIGPQYRGRAVGTIQSAWAVGWGSAVLLQAVVFSALEPELAWRAMFLIGIFPALLIVYVRRNVAEPAISETARAGVEDRRRPGLLAIFAPSIVGTTMLAAVLVAGVQGGYYAITTWLPTYLKVERGLTVINSTDYLTVLILGSFAGYLYGAWFADRYGRRPLFLTFSVGACAIVLVYTQVPISNGVMLVLGFPLGFFASGAFSGLGAFLTELFPTHLRGSGQDFGYNFGRGLGALTPTLVGYLSSVMPLATAMALFASVAYGIMFVAALCLPETRGRDLRAIDQAPARP
ncbi:MULTISPECIES: MFS transporter [unclassified Methylobacterium]|jgi:MFS family permease|uniref:MFS transporter n=1 Tax=unclassified Methylobacterium TaxID=2615210 RepID=UPI001353EDCF|nr:MFS transporter [Methylobacterium sp. 2A]MWV24413.1 MFS transporter [Methylobacterium sp. 2A]